MKARALRQSSEFEARKFEQVVVERFTSRFLRMAMGVLQSGEVPVLDSAHVLDLGCGTGAASFAVLEHLGPNCRVVGVDADEGLLALARQTGWANYGRRLNFLQQDVEDLQFEDATFDLVVANCLLGHDIDEAQALSEIRRVLAPGGRALLTRPLSGTFFEVLETMQEVAETWCDDAMAKRISAECARYPSDHDFTRQVKRVGFQSTSSRVSEFRLTFRSPADIFRDDLMARIATQVWGRAAGQRGEQAFDAVVDFLNTYQGTGAISLGVCAGLVVAHR